MLMGVEKETIADYFGALKMCVRLHDDNPGHQICFRCLSCEHRHEAGRRRPVYEVPAGTYPLLRFSPDSNPHGVRAAVVVPFVLEPFRSHLFHQIAAEIDARWLSVELVTFQPYENEARATIWLNGSHGR